MEQFNRFVCTLSSISSLLDAFWLVWSFSCDRFPLVVLGCRFCRVHFPVLHLLVPTRIQSLCVRSSASTSRSLACSSFSFLFPGPNSSCTLVFNDDDGQVWWYDRHGRLPLARITSSGTWSWCLISCGCAARGLAICELGFSKDGWPLVSLCSTSLCMIF